MTPTVELRLYAALGRWFADVYVDSELDVKEVSIRGSDGFDAEQAVQRARGQWPDADVVRVFDGASGKWRV